jgi:sucrose phosphorylase
LARELGIKRNQLYKWKEEIDNHGNQAFPGHGQRPSTDTQAADEGGPAGHKEINRINLSVGDVTTALKHIVVHDQLNIIPLRDTSPTFNGEITIGNTEEHQLLLSWNNEGCRATLKADLRELTCTITHTDKSGEETRLAFH